MLFFFLFLSNDEDEKQGMGVVIVAAERATCLHPFQQVASTAVAYSGCYNEGTNNKTGVYTGKHKKHLIFFCVCKMIHSFNCVRAHILTLKTVEMVKQEKYQIYSDVFSFLTSSKGGKPFPLIILAYCLYLSSPFLNYISSLVCSPVHLNDSTCPFLLLF